MTAIAPNTIRAALLSSIAGALDVAVAVWFFREIWPRNQGLALGAVVAGLGIAQILSGVGALRGHPVAFRIGRWAALLHVATLGGLFLGLAVVVVVERDFMRPTPAGLLILGFGVLQLYAAYCLRKAAVV